MPHVNIISSSPNLFDGVIVKRGEDLTAANLNCGAVSSTCYVMHNYEFLMSSAFENIFYMNWET